jgi:hypothetical protein
VRTSFWEFVVLRLIVGLLVLIARALGLLLVGVLWMVASVLRVILRPVLRELAYAIGRMRGRWQLAGAGRRPR